MLLIIDNSKEAREELRKKFFCDFAINSCAASSRNFESAFKKHPIGAIYIPDIEGIPNPIGYCRRLKTAYPEIPLIVSVMHEATRIDLDALYRVTDNLPKQQIPMIRLVEIICELQRLYTGRDHLDLCCGSLSITPYTFTVLYCGVPIVLNASAVSILRYLAEAAPRPVPTQELLVSTCAPYRKRNGSAIRTQINELNRSALSAVGCRLVTHLRGQGYVIGEPIRKKE